MTAKCYAFQVGSAEFYVLLDGASHLGREKILKRFPQATEAEYRQAYTEIGLSLDEADTSFNILLAKMGSETILVDMGEGGKPNGGFLLQSLRLAGILPDAVTQVIITHTHGDHVLGMLSDDRKPIFENASYIISREEMRFWQFRIDEGIVDHQPIVTMMQQQGLRFINMDEQIMSGVTAIPLPGHTPGQIGVRFESDGEALLHLADLLHTPMQFAHPEWSATFDADMIASIPTRKKALQFAADEGPLTLFYHLTFPGLGYVRQTETAFAWKSL